MHPTISLDQMRSLTGALTEGMEVDLHSAVKWVGSRAIEFDVDPLKQCADACSSLVEEFNRTGERDKDMAEGLAALQLFDAVGELPLEVLDDAGFWRYVTLAHLWEFVVWREGGSLAVESPVWEKYRVYVDGRKPAECVALRMYLRARIGSSEGDTELVTQIPKATDLWRSHILRVRTSYAPPLARALLNAQRTERLSTDDVRELAKRVQRVSSNVLLQLYSEDECASLLAELRPE